MRESLKRQSLEDRHSRSVRICEKLVPFFAGQKNLGLFAPTLTEPDLDLLWDLGPLTSHLVSYPKCEGEALSFYPVFSLSELISGRFGIRQSKPAPRLEQLDLILVPGLAFTSDGERLGRGAGFYDRFLSTIPLTTIKVGLCFEFQLFSEIPHESHDVRMDAVVYA